MSGTNPAPGFLKHPRHSITLSEPDTPVRLSHAGTVIAESATAILLLEGRCPPRHYIPIADIRMDLLTPSDLVTHCPFKGDARYWSLTVDGQTLENVAWSYDAPFDEMLALQGHIAFDTAQLDQPNP